MITAQQKRDRKTAIQVTFFVVAIFAIFIISPFVFSIVDCNTATKNLKFLNECKAHDNCKLTARELRHFNGYVRLELRSCNKG